MVKRSHFINIRAFLTLKGASKRKKLDPTIVSVESFPNEVVIIYYLISLNVIEFRAFN